MPKSLGFFLPFTQKLIKQQFFKAIDSNDYSTSKVLLEAKIDPNSVDNIHSTPLMHAAIRGHFELVKLLVNNGASIEKIDGHGTSTMTYAKRARANYQEINDFLESR